MFKINAVPAFQDNYIWIMHDQHHAAIVDPGQSAGVIDFLTKHQLTPIAILCTHRHDDHIGGIPDLCAVYNVPVYGKKHPDNPTITHDLREGDTLQLEQLNITLNILEVPGHLDDHLAYTAPGILFCGDILFGASCGKSFEGTTTQLHQSVQKLATLPDHTLIYSAHEYTESNLPFAERCEPNNIAIKRRIQETQQLRAAGQATVPFTLALEKATNPFLRCNEPEIHYTLKQQGYEINDEASTFIALRNWRDRF